MKIWIFLPLAFAWPSNFFWPFFKPSDVLNIPTHSNLNYFESILPSKQFLLKIWQTRSVCTVELIVNFLVSAKLLTIARFVNEGEGI